MPGDTPFEDVGRRHPARGVHIHSVQPTIVFVTVCAHERRPWLANASVQDHLLQAWESAEAWLAGYYLIMPDHLHFFCAPRDLKFTIEQWITFWKRQFRRIHQDPACRFQADAFHYRLRRDENYIEKWNYVRENPLRKGLVQHPEDWPYQGMLNVLQW